jgi:ferredoxin
VSENKETNRGQGGSLDLTSESEISRRDLLMRLSPLGSVKLDTSRCTGCGLCAAECPTGALAITAGEEADSFQLVFQHGICMACGQCVEICPEDCLAVERVLEMERIESRLVLFKDTLARCAGCGSPLGPESMIDRMRARLTAAGQAFSTRFDLCPDCKVKAQLSQLKI